jgi:hypothetical protein
MALEQAGGIHRAEERGDTDDHEERREDQPQPGTSIATDIGRA